MADPTKEISTIDFDAMLGGPLSAMIKAQAQATQSSLDFLNSIGFTDSMDFKLSKNIVNEHGEVEQRMVHYSVPKLTLVNVPFIRVAETTIEFHARIVSACTDEAASRGPDGEESLPQGARLKLRAKYSLRHRRAEGGDDHKNYSMSIKMRAVQDDMPPGLERILSLLEREIGEQPIGADADS